MDYKGIGLLSWKLGSYCFDVGSDILNGLSFLHDSRNTTVNVIFNSTIEGSFLHNETKFYNLSERYQEVEITKPDTIWGVLSLSLVFMPGLILGVAAGMGFIADDWKKCRSWMGALFWLVVGAFFPVIVPFIFIYNIVRMMLKKEVQKYANWMITVASGLEASLEALPQLVLQLHTILNGYDTTWIQCLSIASSFTTIAISSITSDVEFGQSGEDDEDLTWKEKARMFVERLPCYMTTIIFRSLSLTLTISFLREYSPIPIIVLFVELVVVATIRISKSEGNRSGKLANICILVVTNAGSMMSYTMFNNEAVGGTFKEDDQDVASFIKISAIVTTIHHFLVMIVIIIMGSVDPSLLQHWESDEFLLSPSGHDFYWAIIVTMVFGTYSLILLLYRARNIVAIEKKTPAKEESSL